MKRPPFFPVSELMEPLIVIDVLTKHDPDAIDITNTKLANTIWLILWLR